MTILSGSAIVELLREQPQLNGKFDLSLLVGRDISWLLEKQPQFKDVFNCVIVINAGTNKRTIFIKKDEPTIIHLGCFSGTKEEAISAITGGWSYSRCQEERDRYISKVEECFNLL